MSKHFFFLLLYRGLFSLKYLLHFRLAFPRIPIYFLIFAIFINIKFPVTGKFRFGPIFCEPITENALTSSSVIPPLARGKQGGLFSRLSIAAFLLSIHLFSIPFHKKHHYTRLIPLPPLLIYWFEDSKPAS